MEDDSGDGHASNTGKNNSATTVNGLSFQQEEEDSGRNDSYSRQRASVTSSD